MNLLKEDSTLSRRGRAGLEKGNWPKNKEGLEFIPLKMRARNIQVLGVAVTGVPRQNLADGPFRSRGGIFILVWLLS